ncbi:unnamed protein product [Caenorhabditis bovis]|uniref:Uncharacterized protein n=1 Tax=Caenorhabditis bovis TaxID=2654633 RepID=A0A8S1F9S6_9PELO|nr:unnamed protein product [Caenorhabditis bovis]
MAQCPPLVALISSSSAQSAANSRGFKSLSHIFYPFATHELTVREPVANQPITSKVRVDVRDISNDGHLLSLSVLPYVLIQALRHCTTADEAICMFRDVLNRWAEPSEHESFGAYLACLFVVSTADENPMTELSRMIQTQQTLHNSTSTLVIPPYCCSPKWMTSHAKTLKHYILLDDGNLKGTRNCDEIFAQMCTTYGKENCQILKFTSSDQECPPEISKKWSKINDLNDVLSKGLDEAMKQATSSSSTATTPMTGSSLTSPTSSVSTISSSFPPVSVSPTPPSANMNGGKLWRSSAKIFAKSDGDECEKVLKRFLETCLVPHVERELRALHDLAGNRRGIIGKSITSGVKKWFSTGSSQSLSSIPASYSWDSPEMQARRLADLSLMFGNHAFAYQQYRALKKDFESDQAMIAHAVASEMCAVALHSSQPKMTAKQFPVHYLENSVGFLINHSAKYAHIMRCAFNAADVLSDLECYKEAAQILTRLSKLDGDHLVGVAQAHAATLFDEAHMRRKASFYRVLAANRFSNANVPIISFDCYRLAMPNIDEKHWGVLDEHLSVKLLSEGEKAGVMNTKMALECVRRLIAVCPKLSPQIQKERLRKIVHVLDSYADQENSIPINLPNVDLNSVKVIYGERPLWNEMDEDENGDVLPSHWEVLERAAHYSLYGKSTPFRGMQLVSDSNSDNSRARETPAGESFRVMIDLVNPLAIPLNLKNVRLSVVDVQSDVVDAFSVGSLDSLNLLENETKTIGLYVIPHVGCTKFRVDGLLFRLTSDEQSVGVDVKIPLNIQGKRLNKTAKQQKSKVYASDERLSAIVSQNPWPLMELKVKAHDQVAYCDQALRYVVEVENIGKEDVVAMSLATDGIDRVAAGIMNRDVRNPIPPKPAANSAEVCTFDFSGEPFLKVGEKKKFFFDVRAGDEQSSMRASTPTVILVSYRGSNGSLREWRKIINVVRKRLISVEPTLLDEDAGLFSLKTRNCVGASQAALSKINIIRLRCAEFGKTLEDGLEMASAMRKVEIESEQTDTIVVRRTRGGEMVWLNPAEKQSAPDWPCPATPESALEDGIIAKKLGIMWRASIVNNDGHVSSIFGETFCDDPFEKNRIENAGPNHTAMLRISCDAARTTSHDFNSNRICELPVKIKIRNTEPTPANISIRYVPKIREAVDGVHLVPPEARQQIWVDRPVRRARIDGEQQAEVEMKVRVSQASMYDIGASLVIDAKFEGSDEVLAFKVPSILSIVRAVQ